MDESFTRAERERERRMRGTQAADTHAEGSDYSKHMLDVTGFIAQIIFHLMDAYC